MQIACQLRLFVCFVRGRYPPAAPVRLAIFSSRHSGSICSAMGFSEPPLPFLKGEGLGWGLEPIHNDSQAVPLPFLNRPLKKYRQIIDLFHDGYIQN